MNLVSPSQVKGWCIERGFHPNRTLGQNFLIDRNTLEAIVDAAQVGQGSKVLEVGPGLGVLTEALLERGVVVTAVEKDSRLCEWLRESLGGRRELTLIEGDMLRCDLDELLAGGFDALVANLPYSVGTRILLDVAMHRLAPQSITVLVQREVAERFAAQAGDSERGLAGIWLQRLYDVELVRHVKASCFWPRPEVGSTVVRLQRHNRWELDDEAACRFGELTKTAFTQRRKQLAAVYRRQWRGVAATAVGEWLLSSGVQPEARAAELTMEQWCALAGGVPSDQSQN